MLTIRLATPADAAECLRIYRPAIENSSISFEYLVPTLAEMAERIKATLTFGPWLIATDDQAVVGYAYAGPHRTRAAYAWSADVSVYVDPSAHRRGVGRQLYEMLLALLRLQGFHSVFAGITQPNAASMALHQRLGFNFVGTYEKVGFKNGAWHDVSWLQLPLGEFTVPPRPVSSLTEAQKLAQWQNLLGASKTS